MVPCSKIAHIERNHKPYMPDLSLIMKRNALRVAEIWMDDYKHNINLAWNLPFEVKIHHRDKIQFYIVNMKTIFKCIK